KLAEGRPLERRMMAAMGQLDCGQCGYLCQTYAEAVARGEEKSLTRCVPGGKETARTLKELASATSAGAVTAAVAVPPKIEATSPPLPPSPPPPAQFQGALRPHPERAGQGTPPLR